MIRAELTIDLDAVRRNVARLEGLATPARYAAVVKANAYGHGLVPVARALEGRVAAFCVYRVDEAAALRDAHIETPILVLGPIEPSELDGVLAARAAIALWSEGAFHRDAVRAAERRRTRLAVHAKIETGLSRLGIDPERATHVLTEYLQDANLDLHGVYTHLAAAEELESSFTLSQLARFETALAPLHDVLLERGVIRHAAASAAAMLYPALRLDLIRAGIATYGIWPSEETRASAGEALELAPALSWTTELVAVRAVEAGSSVGYGCTYHPSRPSRIGVIPIGYAEGLPRSLSNAGVTLVGGRRVPIVGRICMNMAFVDVTDVPDAVPGNRVTLIGRDGAASIDANEQAALAGSIGYELVTRIPADVPRHYVGDSDGALVPVASKHGWR